MTGYRLDDDLAQLDVVELAAWERELDHAQALDEDRPIDLGAAAAWYARQGWPVFPCEPAGKRPLTRRGFHEATCDPHTIAGWWARWPTANLGHPTGGLHTVIDIDGPAGYGSLTDLRDADALPDVLAAVWTGGGGRHLYVAPDPDLRTGAGLRPGIDVRAAGGYVILPPSMHQTCRRYLWLDRPPDWPT